MKLKISNGTYDEAARESFKVNPASAISWYLASSFVYYTKYESLLSDECYDKMCLYLLNNLDKLEHTNKELVDKEALKAGTAYHLKAEDYPLRVQITADMLIRDLLTWRSMQ